VNYLLLSDNAARQYMDSVTIFSEHARTAERARQYKGGMYWKVEGKYEYLVKTTPDNRQQRIGRRSAETEKIHADFTTCKHQVEERLRSLNEALQEAERLNKALKVGRTPATVVSVLQALHESRVHDYFTVVGTHALYAYEAAASVRIQQGALATMDVDFLWDARKRMQFLTTMARTQTSMLAVLQRADKTFQRKESQLETAINDKGFEVDFLRRQPIQQDPHPFRFTDDEEDLWPVQAERAGVLTDSPRFEQVVVSVTGKMAMMRTIAPESFVQFKLWMAEQAKHRDPAKRRRDVLQARIVQELLSEALLLPSAP